MKRIVALIVLWSLIFPPAFAQTVTPPQVSTASGSYVPAIAFGGASVGITYVVQQGEYVQIGNQVCFNAYVLLSNKGSSTGTFTFPLPVSTARTSLQPFIVYNGQGMTFTGILQALQSGGTSATTIQAQSNTSGTIASLSNTNFANNTDFGVSGCYFTI